MWKSQDGDVVLCGACYELFSEALWGLAEKITIGIYPESTGIKAFDRLSLGQQAAVLDIVGLAALCQDPPSPPINASIEGGFVAAFMDFTQSIENDIERSDKGARSLVIQAAQDRRCWHQIQADEEDDTDAWESQLRDVAESFLCDGSYELFYTSTDMLPEIGSRMRKQVMIAKDYFEWIPDNYEQERIETSMEVLIEPCRSCLDE